MAYRLFLTAWRKLSPPARLRPLQGLLLAPGAPLGWLATQWLLGRDPMANLLAEPAVYLYMLVATAIVFAAFGRYVGVREATAEQRGLHDPLTGLHNVRYFRERLHEACLGLVRGDRRQLCLAVMDLDHFKRVNDNYGHPFGDRMLIEVARRLRAVTRQGETCARIGGEEFGVILAASDSKQALQAAERMREAVAAITLKADNGEIVRITISIGIACLADAQPGADLKLYAAADRLMYRAKQEGRNRVVLETI